MSQQSWSQKLACFACDRQLRHLVPLHVFTNDCPLRPKAYKVQAQIVQSKSLHTTTCGEIRQRPSPKRTKQIPLHSHMGRDPAAPNPKTYKVNPFTQPHVARPGSAQAQNVQSKSSYTTTCGEMQHHPKPKPYKVNPFTQPHVARPGSAQA